MSHPRKVLSVFSLVMINVIAVDSLRTLPISAALGFPLVFFYLPAALLFFIPIGLVAAELATSYPQTGGIYIWVREAFGLRAGFTTIWLQWIYNVVWYPTIMAFIAATIAYLFAPELANNKYYLVTSSIILFWLFTLLNCYGMRVSSFISTLGALIGTLFPMLTIITLGFFWLWHGHVSPNNMSFAHWLPHYQNWSAAALFPGVLFGLIGLEMSAVHAEEAHNPQRDYPRAIAYSTLLIVLTLVLSSLAIVLVIPAEKLSIISGLIDALKAFFHSFGLDWMLSVLVVLIILGSLSSVSAWIIGPTKGLLISAKDGSLPQIFSKTNQHHAPTSILFTQGIIFTLLSSVFVLSDSVNAAYWLLSDLSSQLALLMYIFMFAAAIKLRYSQPNRSGSYRIPGGNRVLWLLSTSGIVCCLFAMAIGFIPPPQLAIKNTTFFECFLIGGLILFSVILPWLFAKKR